MSVHETMQWIKSQSDELEASVPFWMALLTMNALTMIPLRVVIATMWTRSLRAAAWFALMWLSHTTPLPPSHMVHNHEPAVRPRRQDSGITAWSRRWLLNGFATVAIIASVAYGPVFLVASGVAFTVCRHFLILGFMEGAARYNWTLRHTLSSVIGTGIPLSVYVWINLAKSRGDAGAYHFWIGDVVLPLIRHPLRWGIMVLLAGTDVHPRHGVRIYASIIADLPVHIHVLSSISALETWDALVALAAVDCAVYTAQSHARQSWATAVWLQVIAVGISSTIIGIRSDDAYARMRTVDCVQRILFCVWYQCMVTTIPPVIQATINFIDRVVPVWHRSDGYRRTPVDDVDPDTRLDQRVRTNRLRWLADVKVYDNVRSTMRDIVDFVYQIDAVCFGMLAVATIIPPNV